jgi:hypothetical protein
MIEASEGSGIRDPQSIGEAIRLEYTILREQIAEADRTCVVMLGVLITGTLTLVSVSLSQRSPGLACMLVPVWLIGHLYLAEKRSVIVHTAHYIWTELERRHDGLNWEGWHHYQIYQEGTRPARYYPFYLECAVASVVVLINPFLIFYITHHWFSPALITSILLVLIFFAVMVRGVLLYTRFEKYLAELSLEPREAPTRPVSGDTSGRIAPSSSSPRSAG